MLSMQGQEKRAHAVDQHKDPYLLWDFGGNVIACVAVTIVFWFMFHKLDEEEYRVSTNGDYHLEVGLETQAGEFVLPVVFEAGVDWPCHDPPPDNSSIPCLRIHDSGTGDRSFLFESGSIMLYLESALPGPAMIASSLVGKAMAQDMLTMFHAVGQDVGYELRHTIIPAAMFFGLKVDDQHGPSARNAREHRIKGLVRLQNWALRGGMDKTGWMTPYTQGPGLVDAFVASGIRHTELVYEWDLIESEELGPLRVWYARYQKLPLWADFEDMASDLPEHMKSLRDPASSRNWA